MRKHVFCAHLFHLLLLQLVTRSIYKHFQLTEHCFVASHNFGVACETKVRIRLGDIVVEDVVLVEKC